MPRWRNGWIGGCVAGLITALAAAGVSAQDAGGASAPKVELPVDQVEAIVRDLLRREPELVYQALEELQRRETAAEAERRNADLIVLGSSPRWRRQSRFFSPTVDHVLKHAHCEVLVVAFPEGVFEDG